MAKRKRTYNFNSEWEESYCFTEYNGKAICLLCNAHVSQPKKSNIERHFSTCHKIFDTHFLVNSEIRKQKIKNLKSCLLSQQNVFLKPKQTSTNATIASYKICHVLAKRKKPFSDGEIIKEAMLCASESLFDGYKEKSEMISSIKNMQLSHQTVARRTEMIASDLKTQLNGDIQSCSFFSLQLDESTDISDTAQLAIFVRMIFNNFTVKEEFLALLPLYQHTRGEDIFKTFVQFSNDIGIPISKLVAITTDGAPSMIGVNNGFLALCAKDEYFPKFLSYHCIIHQEALCAKVLKFDHIMKVIVKTINYIRSSSTRHRLFKELLCEVEAEHGDVLFHSEVRWLSRGKTLERFFNLLSEIKEFLHSVSRPALELTDINWLLDFAFLTDITIKLNELNLQLQGRNIDISDMISTVNAFRRKLKLWISQLNTKMLSHFPHLNQVKSKYCDDQCELSPFIKNLDILLVEFNSRFAQFTALEPIVMFLKNPFMACNVNQIATLMCKNFIKKTQVEDAEVEIITFQEDISMKALLTEKNFWNMIDPNKYPLIRSTALQVYSCFGSTYLCESVFSSMKMVKAKNRASITDSHIEDTLRISSSHYVPDFSMLAEKMQCQISH